MKPKKNPNNSSCFSEHKFVLIGALVLHLSLSWIEGTPIGVKSWRAINYGIGSKM